MDKRLPTAALGILFAASLVVLVGLGSGANAVPVPANAVAAPRATPSGVMPATVVGPSSATAGGDAGGSGPVEVATRVGAGSGGATGIELGRAPGVPIGEPTPEPPTASIPSPTAPPNSSLGSTAQDLSAWGPPAAPEIDPRRFTEAHWQGLEVIPNTPTVAAALKLPPGLKGVIVDDVTLPADLQGFQAGDVVTHVGATPTPDLQAFIGATDQLRELPRADVRLIRDGQMQDLVLAALGTRLGTANGETPSMIPPGARMPHPYRGPCTNCHRIGTTGTLPVDQGDLVTTAAPVIRVGAVRPHRDRGPCAACHQIVP